jgi:hypothetical protein
MNGPSRGTRWARLLVAALIAIVVGVTAYNLGFSHGVAQQLPAAAAGPYPYPWPYRPWGVGFGFVIPMLFLFFLLRALLWGGPWRRGWYGGYGGYYGRGCAAGAPGVPPAFEEWHRRAHEQDRQQRPAAPTT